MSKKFNYKLGVAVWSFALLTSCGDIEPKGAIVTKDIKVEEFKGLNAEGKFRLFYINSPENFVAVETYPNLADNVDVFVKDKVLNIIEKRNVKKVDFYNITIYSKYNLENISVSDSVELNLSSAIKTDNFKLVLKNNAKFIGAVSSRKTNLEMENSSRANLLGSADKAFIKIKDTASLIAPYWNITNLDLQTKNGIYAEVNVEDTLKGNILNTSRLLYYNDPIRAFKIDKSATVENKKLDEINTK